MPNDAIIQRFGEKLRALRAGQEMSQKRLAKVLGLTAHGYISELEAGKKRPTVELVLKISRLFGVTTDSLIKDELELMVPDASQSLAEGDS